MLMTMDGLSWRGKIDWITANLLTALRVGAQRQRRSPWMISVVMDMMMFLIFLALVGAPSFGFSWISHVYKQFHPGIHSTCCQLK
jgi:hypothetical protein